MSQDEIAKLLRERTGRHICIGCLRDVTADEFFRNDHMCDRCVNADSPYPLASSPESVETSTSEAAAADGGKSRP